MSKLPDLETYGREMARRREAKEARIEKMANQVDGMFRLTDLERALLEMRDLINDWRETVKQDQKVIEQVLERVEEAIHKALEVPLRPAEPQQGRKIVNVKARDKNGDITKVEVIDMPTVH